MSAPSFSLSPGDRLGRYQIVALLGAGGMGEVYRAHDPHLKRDVALKIVRRPAAGPEQLARFTREARAASSLNHPNIVAVFDAGIENGVPFVVSELLEGETLRARLDRGPIPFRKAVDYGIQIALALDAAHAGKIWHRDVKPANVFIMNDGRVKLLDFGIAKLSERNLQADANEPTTDISESQEVLGTAGYMSPEQVLGQALDHRTDIFSLGTVLYEMFTRTRAFKRASNVDTMHAVLHDDPVDPLTISPSLPPMASAIVRRCLEKNKEERFQSTRDLAFDLKQLRETTTRTGPLHAPSLTFRRKVIPALAGAVLVAAGLGLGMYLRRPSDPPAFEQLTFSRARIGAAKFIAGGRGIVYSEARERDALKLWRIDPEEGPSARALGEYPVNTEVLAARTREVALLMNRRIVGTGQRFVGTLAVGPWGGKPRELAEGVEDADWDPPGTGMAVVRSTGGSGGSSWLEYPLGTERYKSTGAIRFPRISRDGRHVAFLDDPVGNGEGGEIAVLDLGAKAPPVRLTQRWNSVRGVAWSADGSEIWFAAGDSRTNRVLRAVDLRKKVRVVLGAPGPLGLWDIAPDRRVLLTRDEGRRSLIGVRDGQTGERDLSLFDDSGLADVSDDGRLVLFTDRYGIYLGSTEGGTPTPLGLNDAFADDLTRDGTKILATRRGANEVVIVPVKAGSNVSLKPYNITSYRGAYWFPDGKRIFFAGREKDPGHALRTYVQDIDGGPPKPLTPENIWGLSINPTGTMIAATGDEQPGISLWPVDGGPSTMVAGSIKNDRPVAWSSDGRYLWIFRRGEVPVQIIKLEIATGRREIWQTLQPSDPAGVDSITEFAITPDGRTYFYGYSRLISQLYVAREVR